MKVELPVVDESGRAKGERCEIVELRPIDREQAERIAEIGKAIGDPIRAQIVEVLRGQPESVCACDLEPLFDISQPTLSHHLRKLKDAGLVDFEKRGLWKFYRVREAELEELRRWAT